MASTLTLPEEIMLLTLEDETGKVERVSFWTGHVNYKHAVAGAVLAELALQDRIEIKGKGDAFEVVLLDATPIGSGFVDACLEEIAAEKKTMSGEHWVGKLAAQKDMRGRIASQLADKDILNLEHDSAWIVFTKEVYPTMDPAPELALRERLRSAVMGDDPDVDTRTCALLAIGGTTGFNAMLFTKEERGDRKERIESLIAGDAAGDAVAAKIASIQAMVMMIVIIGAIAAS